MTTSSIPWYENAAWTRTLRIARKRSQPMWLGSMPERAIAPGFFQNWFLKFRLLCFAKSVYVDILWNQCGRPEVLHQDQWSIQQEVDQWSGPLSRMNYFMTSNKNIVCLHLMMAKMNSDSPNHLTPKILMRQTQTVIAAMYAVWWLFCDGNGAM